MSLAELWKKAANKSDEQISFIIDDFEKEVGKKFNAEERADMIKQVRDAHENSSPQHTIFSSLYSILLNAHDHCEHRETFADVVKTALICSGSFGEMSLLDQLIPLCKDEAMHRLLTACVVKSTEGFIKRLEQLQTLALLFEPKEDK